MIISIQRENISRLTKLEISGQVFGEYCSNLMELGHSLTLGLSLKVQTEVK